MGIELIPAHLLDPDKEDDFLLWLLGLPIPPRRKKNLLVEWTKYLGLALTREMVEAALGDQVDEA